MIESVESLCLLYICNYDCFERHSYIKKSFFTSKKAASIYEAIKKMHADRVPQDVIVAFVADETNSDLFGLPSKEHEEETFNILVSNRRMSILNKTCLFISNKITSEKISTKTMHDECLCYVESQLEKICSIGPPSHKENAIKSVLDKIEENVKYFRKTGRRADEGLYIKTGIQPLDSMSSLYRGGLWIIGARPGCGKTTLALNIINNLFRSKKATLLFSLEMPQDQIVRKMITMNLAISSDNLQSGNMSEQEYDSLKSNKESMSAMKCTIVDEVNTLSQMRAHIAVLMKKYKYDLIVLDYIQLLQIESSQNRNDQIAECSRFLKRSAIKYNIPIIALSQLNRKSTEASEPQMSHLRESGSLEQDADTVILLEEGKNSEELKMRIVKNRFGTQGMIEVSFDKRLGIIQAMGEKKCKESLW